MYFVTALVPSLTACFASSPGSRSRTEVWISREDIVLFLTSLDAFESTFSKRSLTKEFMMFIAFVEFPTSGWTPPFTYLLSEWVSVKLASAQSAGKEVWISREDIVLLLTSLDASESTFFEEVVDEGVHDTHRFCRDSNVGGVPAWGHDRCIHHMSPFSFFVASQRFSCLACHPSWDFSSSSESLSSDYQPCRHVSHATNATTDEVKCYTRSEKPKIINTVMRGNLCVSIRVSFRFRTHGLHSNASEQRCGNVWHATNATTDEVKW